MIDSDIIEYDDVKTAYVKGNVYNLVRLNGESIKIPFHAVKVITEHTDRVTRTV